MRSTDSSRLSALTAPVCRITASQIAWEEASEAVCDRVARAPASVRPPFQMTTGFFSAASRSTRKKRRPSRTPSTYMPIASVSASAAKYSRQSEASSTTALPILITLLILSPLVAASREKLIPCVPLCEMKPMLPPSHCRLFRGKSDAGAGVVDAHTVGANDEQVVFDRRVGDRFLQLHPKLLARFGKARGEHLDTADVFPDAICDDAWGHLSWHGTDHQVDVVGDVQQAREVRYPHLLNARDVVLVNLHRVKLAFEGAHVAEPHVTARLLVADHGDGARVEHSIEALYHVAHSALRRAGLTG